MSSFGANGHIACPSSADIPEDVDRDVLMTDTAWSDRDDQRPLILSGRVWKSFVAQTVVIAAGCVVPFDEAQWRDALVIVESGEVELKTTSGQQRLFRAGELLWLTGLPLRSLHNPGDEPVVLKAVSRRSDTRADQPPGLSSGE
jgi:quercetin dioxygenase-like cupin family protein